MSAMDFRMEVGREKNPAGDWQYNKHS